MVCMHTAAIYLRQSEDRDGNMLAVDRQREDCVKLAAHKGWSWTEYLDNDTSATNGKRRGAYEQMLADIRAGLVDAVVAWDLDRLTDSRASWRTSSTSPTRDISRWPPSAATRTWPPTTGGCSPASRAPWPAPR